MRDQRERRPEPPSWNRASAPTSVASGMNSVPGNTQYTPAATAQIPLERLLINPAIGPLPILSVGRKLTEFTMHRQVK